MERDPEAGPVPANARRRGSVLVVDDDPTILRLLRVFLERQGFAVLTALEGSHALALARRTLPDLVLADLMLPGMDGRELRQHLLADLRTAGIPVILITADVTVTAQAEPTFADVITKPFVLADVLERIRRHIR